MFVGHGGGGGEVQRFASTQLRALRLHMLEIHSSDSTYELRGGHGFFLGGGGATQVGWELSTWGSLLWFTPCSYVAILPTYYLGSAL